MTRTVVLLMMTFSLFALPPLRAQDQAPSVDLTMQDPSSIDSAIEVTRAGMQADRTTIIGVAMNFSGNDGAAFWPVYRQYERERATLEDRRVAVIREYAKKYPALTDAEAKTMAEQMFEYDSRLAMLRKKYFKKFNKVLPALTVTKFFQLERRIDLMMDMQVESSLPPLTQAKYVAQPK